MSFHGGLVGVALSILIFSKKNNLDYIIYFDTVSAVAPIGLFFEGYQILSMENFMEHLP